MEIPKIVNFRKCTLGDIELSEKVAAGLSKMYQTGRLPDRHIPAQPDNDFDLLTGELLVRFIELRKAAQSVLDGWDHPENTGEMWIPDFCGEPIESLRKLIK